MSNGPNPGWYADPAGGGHERWWDGTAWTQALRAHPGDAQHRRATSPEGAASEVPGLRASPASEPNIAGGGRPERKKRTSRLIGVTAGALLLIGIVSFGMLRAGPTASDTTAGDLSTTRLEAETSETPEGGDVEAVE